MANAGPQKRMGGRNIKAANAEPENRRKALETAMKSVEKQFGEEAAYQLNDASIQNIAVIPTGSLTLDHATGIGGIPAGRIVEIYGPESSGKTTLMLHAIAEAQKVGGNCAFIDAEHALDPQYAQNLGVNTDDLVISQPDSGDEALEIADTFARSGAFDLVIIDSVAALTPKAEIEGDMGDAHVGLHARLMSQALRKLGTSVKQSGTTVCFINQIRMKIGVMFGSPETTTGGNALKFYASMRLDIRRTGSVKVGEEHVGNETRVKTVKNKCAPPFRQAEFQIRFGEGIDRTAELIDLGAKYHLVQKSGAWFSYNGTRIGQGRENVRKYLKEHPEMADEIQASLEQVLFESGDEE